MLPYMMPKEPLRGLGQFGDFYIDGVLLSQRRKVLANGGAFHTVGSSGGSEPGLYVSGDSISCIWAGMHSPSMDRLTREPIEPIDPSVKSAIQAAAQQWERE